MSRTLCSLAASVLLTVVSSCSSDLTPEQRGMPCNECDYGYVPAKKSSERRVWCIKDGRTLDCKKTPAECPQCRKILGQDSGPSPAD